MQTKPSEVTVNFSTSFTDDKFYTLCNSYVHMEALLNIEALGFCNRVDSDHIFEIVIDNMEISKGEEPILQNVYPYEVKALIHYEITEKRSVG